MLARMKQTAEGLTRNWECSLAQTPVDCNLGRSLAIMLLTYLSHQLYQGLDVPSLVLGEQQTSCSLRVVVTIILACTQHQLLCTDTVLL